MAAVQFARRVSNACGVNLPASFVLDKSHTVESIIARVEALVRCACFSSRLDSIPYQHCRVK